MARSRTRTISKYFILCAIVCAAIFHSASARASPLQISVFDYPPYIHKKTPNKGLGADLIREAFRTENIQVEFVFHPAKRGATYVARGKLFATIGTLHRLPEEIRRQITSVPLFYARVSAFYRTDRLSPPSFKKLSDLDQYKIGVINGGIDNVLLKRRQSLKLTEVDSLNQIFQLVHNGRLDLGISFGLSGWIYLKLHYNQELDQWGIAQDVLASISAHLIISKKYENSQQYQRQFERGLKTIRTNGTYKHLFERYYGEGQVPLHVMDEQQKEYMIPNE